MNIFCLQLNPVAAARDNCDIHTNKMLLECAQLLANCFTLEDLKSAPKIKTGEFRSHSYLHHPISKWVMLNNSNFEWTLLHAVSLEIERRKNGYKKHFSFDFLGWVCNNLSKSQVPEGDLTTFAVAINEQKNCRKLPGFDALHPVEQYRAYYIFDKPFAKWKTRPTPQWFLDKNYRL